MTSINNLLQQIRQQANAAKYGWNVPADQRTVAQVQAARHIPGGGCCDQYCDNQGCDCLAVAERYKQRQKYPNCGLQGQDLECVECGVRLYGKRVEDVCRRMKR